MRPVVALSALVLAAAGCSHGGSKTKAIHDRIPGAQSATGFAMNGRRIAWVGPDAVVADLDTGKRWNLGPGTGGPAREVALSGTTVLWLDLEGGNLREYTLHAASTTARKRLAKWFDYGNAPRQPFFGGVSGSGESLAFALWTDAPVGNPDDCIDEPQGCTLRVVGGGTFLVSPGSLALRRVLPPARAVAVHGKKVAAAIFRTGTVDTGTAQIVVRTLPGRSRQEIGKPARVWALALDGDRVAALIAPDNSRGPSSLRVWDLADGQLVSALRVPEGATVLALAGSQAVLRGGGEISNVDLRSGRRRVVSRSRKNEMASHGPWISGGRVWWVEMFASGTPRGRALLRSAPLP